MAEYLKTYGRQKKLKKLFLEQLAKTPNISVVAEKTGIPRSTYYRWVKEDPDFGLLALEIYTEGVQGVNDMAVSQLFKLMKEGDRHSILFWLGTRHPEFGGTITRMKKPEGVAGLSKEKREALRVLLAHREAYYNERMDRENNVPHNEGNQDNGDSAGDLSPNTEETAS